MRRAAWALTLTAISLVASAAALRGLPALPGGNATFRIEGPPLPGEELAWTGAYDEVDASLATVPWILRRDMYVDSLLAPGHIPSPTEAAWLAAARRALGAAVALQPPYMETSRFDATPDAAAYRIDLHAGERLRVELGTEPADVDLFAELLDADGATVLIARTGAGVLEHVAASDGPVLLRIQPLVGESAEFTLAVTTRSALLFPVQGRGTGAILGHFYEPRDGGARRHKGVDIHAPHGTPVIAAADGIVERVQDTPLGGRVVYLRESGADRVHYYAHLDTQLVRPGARVKAGDVIGTVGTTGNAVGTAPHLHFEVQVGGRTVDPVLFLYPDSAQAIDAAAATGSADPAMVRAAARVRLSGAALRPSTTSSARAAALPRHSTVQVLGVSGRHYRVRTADGAEGFLAHWLLEPLPLPLALDR